MKSINFLILSLLSFCFVSCSESNSSTKSSNKNELRLIIESELGNLGEYLSIADSVFIFKMEKTDSTLSSSRSGLKINVNKSVASDQDFVLAGEIVDEDHMSIGFMDNNDKLRFDVKSKNDWDFDRKYNYVLSKGTIRTETENKTLKKSDFSEEEQKTWDEDMKKFEEEWDKARNKGVYLIVTPRRSAEYVPYTKNSSYSDNDEDSFDSKVSMEDGDVSIDAFLDEYEKFWSSYAAFVQSLDKNDPTAMMEYSKLMSQAKSYTDKMEKMKGSLSAEQFRRLMDMNRKYIQLMN